MLAKSISICFYQHVIASRLIALNCVLSEDDDEHYLRHAERRATRCQLLEFLSSSFSVVFTEHRGYRISVLWSLSIRSQPPLATSS